MSNSIKKLMERNCLLRSFKKKKNNFYTLGCKNKNHYFILIKFFTIGTQLIFLQMILLIYNHT